MPGRTSLDAVRAMVRSLVSPPAGAGDSDAQAAVLPLITISRQTGTNAPAIAAELVDILNRESPGEQYWLEYDSKLVELVAEEHDLSEELVAHLSERDDDWFQLFTAGLAGRKTPPDVPVKTAKTIRALRRIGRAVIVGRAGQCTLAGSPNVLHIRLVAPLEWRIEEYARMVGESPDKVESAIKRMDDDRADVVRRRFNRDIADPTLYHAVINVANFARLQVAEVIVSMMRSLELI